MGNFIFYTFYDFLKNKNKKNHQRTNKIVKISRPGSVGKWKPSLFLWLLFPGAERLSCALLPRGSGITGMGRGEPPLALAGTPKGQIPQNPVMAFSGDIGYILSSQHLELTEVTPDTSAEQQQTEITIVSEGRRHPSLNGFLKQPEKDNICTW